MKNISIIIKKFMIILSSPSGAGKTTLAKEICARSYGKIRLSLSSTTRPPRLNEKDGKHYHFLSPQEFDNEKDNFLEYACVFGNMYGTSRKIVCNHMSQGCDVILDIDWQGARSLRKEKLVPVVSIFVLPPSMSSLRDRLKARGDLPQKIEERMQKAHGEISHCQEYNYVVINNNLSEAVRDVEYIIAAERLKIDRMENIDNFIQEKYISY